MSSLYADYQAYLNQIYTVLICIFILVVMLISGFHLIRVLLPKHPARETIEYVYLCLCASAWLALIVFFTRAI